MLLVGDSRPTPGRLAGEGAYRRWREKTADQLQAEIGRVLADEDTSQESPSLLDDGLIRLLAGDTTAAIATLELAARDPRNRGDASAANGDLSAAYLSRFVSDGDVVDLLRAVQAADRALAFDGANAAASFNRAVALTMLGTRNQADRAWRVLNHQRAADSGWRDEAVSLRSQLNQRSDEERWALFLPALESNSVSRADLDSVVSQVPDRARAFAEESLLARWASAAASGDQENARRSIEAASMIAAALRSVSADQMLTDALTAIDRTMESGTPSQQAALLGGLRDFREGVAQYHEQNLSSARDPLLRSAKALASVRNPLGHWARFYLAVADYYADADAGLEALDQLLTEISTEQYPALTGRIEWMRGTIDNVQGRIQSSVHRYERAAASLRRAGGKQGDAFVAVLLAESYTRLGEHALAWESRRQAFRRVPLSEGPRRTIAMWLEAKEALLHQNSLELAGPFVEEAVACAVKWDNPLGRASAYVDRSTYRIEVGLREGALADLGQAKAAIEQMEPSGLREQMNYIALVTEGLCYRTTAPDRAAVSLKKGLEGQNATGNRFEAITYTTELAAAQLASDNASEAAATFERALEILEEIRSTVEDPVSRMQAFRRAQRAFDSLIDLRTSRLMRDREEAFELAERARARVFLDLREEKSIGRRGSAGNFARLEEIERVLPKGTALVSYVVLESRIVAWVVEDGVTRQLTLPTTRGDLQEAIERFRLELQRNSSVDAIREASAVLYDAVIRPLGLSENGRAVIAIPDRWLARVPFAALFDRNTKHYLIEKRTVAIAPSATLLVRGIGGASRPASVGALSALTLGVSRPGSYRRAKLPPLPQAEREAKDVANLYSSAAFLRDGEATRENFLRLSVSRNVVHFAGHAVVDLEAPRRSVLLFSHASGSGLAPMSLGELFEAGVGDPRLVVLSACRTQDSLADDREGILGLAGAFIAAGVSEVVASPLDVNDASAAFVMVAFHRRYRDGDSAAVAFQRAVLDLLQTGPVEARSPATWGPFTVIQGSLVERGM